MRLLTLILCLFYLPSFAQNADVFRIDSLPTEGVLLDKGWKFHVGDNPEWAKPDFDDSGWEGIDPTKEITDLPQIRNAELGWFRIHLKMDSSVANTIVSLFIHQAIASEIYHNGQFIGSLGKVSGNSKDVIAYNPFSIEFSQVLHLYTGNKEEHVLAVRFAVQPITHYKKHFGFGYSCLSLRFFKSDNIKQNTLNLHDFEKRGGFYLGNTFDYFKAGLFFIMCILHFFFYFSIRAHKANLYFGIMCLLFVVIYSSQAVTWQYLNCISDRILFFRFFWFALEIATLFMLVAVYSLFSYKRSIVFKILAITVIVFLVFEMFNYEFPFYVGFFLTIFISSDITRLSFKAYRDKKNGALILLIGSICWITALITYIFTYPSNPSLGIPMINHIAGNLTLVSIPICITLFLANEFALTSRSLAQRLKEVETLSAEKQYILATQNEMLEKQVAERTAELKASQAQLIQKEKLASLGELTAGIAHEIQNPLNFVNNFSELSVDLANELKDEIKKPDLDRDLIEDLANDLSQNQEKINHHGKRASSIVKGMLEHSRASTGVKELTDINKLADEYLRLAYHGLRAKDKDFNCDIKTDFDENLPKINIIPHDIGRVLLNLINNAFYAVNERSKQLLSQGGAAPAPNLGDVGGYTPSVTVATQQLDNQILIKIKDNGIGMSEALQSKIFQPFFTTKPTGEGTGLGLSLSYDIVTKGHGGTLEVVSTEGVGSEFSLILPLK